nr:hypothetical protein OG781_26935 [Streptomyces sp. NBC_00830]
MASQESRRRLARDNEALPEVATPLHVRDTADQPGLDPTRPLTPEDDDARLTQHTARPTPTRNRQPTGRDPAQNGTLENRHSTSPDSSHSIRN